MTYRKRYVLTYTDDSDPGFGEETQTIVARSHHEAEMAFFEDFGEEGWRILSVICAGVAPVRPPQPFTLKG